MSMLTTMVFLASLSCGIRLLEIAICIFVAIMSIALWVEMSFVGPDSAALIKGWAIGFVDTTKSDIFALAGILVSQTHRFLFHECHHSLMHNLHALGWGRNGRARS